MSIKIPLIRKAGVFMHRLYLSFFSLETQARKAGVSMGQHNYIASKFWSSEPYLIKVGSNCQITAGVKILTHGGGNAVRDQYPQFDCFGKVEIGDYVYIGTNSLIMPGVSIGDNVLVAAGSIVTKSIPSGKVVGGSPAKILCTVDEYIEKNMRYNLNSKSLSAKDKQKMLLTLDETMFIKKGELH